MGNGDALELMKASHKRSIENINKHKACTVEGHASLIDASTISMKDSEIIYFALQEIPEQVIEKLNGQAKAFSRPEQLSSRKDETKIEYGKLKVTTHSVEVANAIIKVAGIVVVIGMFIYGTKFLSELKHDVVSRVELMEAKVIE